MSMRIQLDDPVSEMSVLFIYIQRIFLESHKTHIFIKLHIGYCTSVSSSPPL